jgi:hypothetical protein
MSKSNVVKPLAIVCSGFILGYLGMMQFQNSKNFSQTSFASKQKSAPLVFAKQHMLTSVKVQTPEKMPESDLEEVTLIGYVSLHQEIDRPLYWEWVLPAGVKVVKGDVKDYKISPLSGKTYITEITVTGFSKEEKKTIALQGYVETDSNRKGNSFIVSSDPESSYEYIAPEIREQVDAEREIASSIEQNQNGKNLKTKNIKKKRQIQF